MRRLRPLVLLAAATLSCQVILGLEEPKGIDGTTTTTEPPDAGSDASDECVHARPPPKPLKDDDTDTKKAFWIATRRLTRLTTSDAGVRPGFDVDDSCTCGKDARDGAAPCTTPERGSTCDFAGGVDDGFATLTEASPIPSGVDPLTEVNEDFETGVRTMLFFIKDYNGKANDSDVGLEVVNSGGLYTNLGCANEPRPLEVTLAAPPGAPGDRYRPAFDGCDRWSPQPGQTQGAYPTRTTTTTGPAYVTNGDLVVEFKEAGAALFGGVTSLTNGIAVVHLTTDANGKLRGDGILSGRIGFDSLIDLVGRTSVANGKGGSEPLCQSDFWRFVGPSFCRSKDTMLSPAEEFLGKSCDATTVVFGAEFVEVQVSDAEFTNPQMPSICPPSSKVECQP